MVTRAKANVVDSSAWLAYFADTANAERFAAAIEDERKLVTPAICLLEVFKVIARQRGESDALGLPRPLPHPALVAAVAHALPVALPLLAPAEGAAAAGAQFIRVAVHAIPAHAAITRPFGFS